VEYLAPHTGCLKINRCRSMYILIDFPTVLQNIKKKDTVSVHIADIALFSARLCNRIMLLSFYKNHNKLFR
jgi:hypothetical protein